MRKILIVTLFGIVVLNMACQSGTLETVAPIITEAPKPSKTVEGQYSAINRELIS